MTEKNYIVKCDHNDKDTRCNNNKDKKCTIHCEKSWKCASEAQARVLKYTHISEHLLHRPEIEKL